MNGENSISVVLPVFNAEKTIAKCIENALRSLREDDELIIIDDGSTDNTQSICLEYAWNNTNVIYKYQDKKGMFPAKLVGIECASGRYVSFIDSDDVCAENRFNVMHAVASANEADIFFFGATIKEVGRDTEIYDTNMLPGCYSNKAVLEEFGKLLFGRLESDDNSYTGYLWNTLISKEALEGLQEYAGEKIYFFDDEIIMLHAITKAKKCVVSEKKLYRYDFSNYKNSKKKKGYGPRYWENIVAAYNLKKEMAIENDLFTSEIRQRLSTFLGPISFMRFILEPNITRSYS